MRVWRQRIAVAVGCTAVLALGGVTGAQADASRLASASDTVPQVPEWLDRDQDCTHASKRPVAKTPWAQQAIGLRRAQELSLGDGVTVGVVDTGVDSGVPALKGRVLGGGTGDCVGHGTFAAGIVAAAPAEGVGFIGVAPHARILGVRATAEKGTTDADTIAAGITAAVDRGCDVVLVSVPYGRSSKQLKSAVEHALKKDVVVVAPAAGGDRSGAPAYPGALPGVVGVGSVGVDGAPYPSGREATSAPPDVVAPGDRLISVGPGGGHFTASGDTVAAAYVAGTAALVRAHDPSLSARDVVARIQATAVRPSGRVPGPLAGYGMVDPVAAVSGVPVSSGTPAAAAGAGARPYRAPKPEPAVAALPAWGVAGGAVVVIALAAVLAVVVPRGRARGWRPGNHA
ncbi:S8 family serine peptidase [Streptomyces sp. AK02-01A]|uniref:S8 family serine peptidase n=1 Tax=Streptomyces sp. AK02-01A TaxID=3028648 RepID=UPI0029B8D78D|nr:S8 family serine peptidase [Streptomyces sp. AK02-01A]MDX3849462.1 S8 family serine peptidase [Streptomyces sp. AK02-01A]